MPPKRKPFSNKQKKAQLQRKKQERKERVPFGASDDTFVSKATIIDGNESTSSGDEDKDSEVAVDTISVTSRKKPLKKPHPQAIQSVIRRYDPNRFRLRFHQETQEEVEKSKLKAKTVPLTKISKEELEVGLDDVYQPGSVLDIPTRPPWDYSMSKDEVEKREEEMFLRYVQTIFASHSPSQLSYFELNLETWRQLWRVLEISDLVLMITDIRHPALHFPPALYKYVVEDLKKQIVLVLNKVDLVPPQVVVAWKHYFCQRFPGLSVVCFSSYPNRSDATSSERVKFKLRKKGTFRSAIGPQELYNIVESLYKDAKFDVSLWQRKLSADESADKSYPFSCDKDAKKNEEMITIGLLGHPNVGKSSILNGLMEKKTVSTSRTPGHTKHFQTIFLTPNIRLCDCPGLVFPSLVSKQLQILSGMYPIAQVREPYTAVGYLAERVPLVKMLSLKHPAAAPVATGGTSGSDVIGGTDGIPWTPWDVCEAWAERRGYFTRRGGKPDAYRAANDLLRLAADGRICLYFRPPGFSINKAEWDSHPDVKDMIALQSRGGGGGGGELGGALLDYEGEEFSDTSGSELSNDELFITPDQTKFSALIDIKFNDD